MRNAEIIRKTNETDIYLKLELDGKTATFDKTAEGNMQVSTPQAEIIGKATVKEHCPTQEMS